MGKLKLYLKIFVFQLFSTLVYSQEYKINYEVLYKPDSLSAEKTKENYELNINVVSFESFYRPLNEENSLNISIYKNLKKNEFIKYETYGYNVFELNYKNKFKAWKTESGEKNILGYVCKKAKIAFGGRIWEAWYCKDLPMQDGPYKFCNLPGLILEIRSLDGDYSFKAIEIKKNVTSQIQKPKATLFKNEIKELEYKNEIIKDPALIHKTNENLLKLQKMRIKVTYDGEEISPRGIEQQIIEEFLLWKKSHNNPIEKGFIWIKL